MGTLVDETTKTQEEAIRKHLLKYGWIDKRVALHICDCDRLGARIWDIRHDPVSPMKIETVKRGKKNRYGHIARYAEYHLVKEEEQESGI